MKISIITPCTRVHNLPIIYKSILNTNYLGIEWIIVYDSNDIDKRILQYQEQIPILLFNLKSNENQKFGGVQRNLGIQKASGDYIYFLDDDNIMHPEIFTETLRFLEDKKIVILNQFNKAYKNKRFLELNKSIIGPGAIDTAQFIVPSIKEIKWNENYYYHDFEYIRDIINSYGEDNVFYYDRCYSYRNYLKY